MPRFDENHKSLMFRDSNGRLHNNIELVTVKGIYDTQKHQYVDTPNVTGGWGSVGPERVAEMVGIKNPLI